MEQQKRKDAVQMLLAMDTCMQQRDEAFAAACGLLGVFPAYFVRVPIKIQCAAQDIRLRKDAPVTVSALGKNWFLCPRGVSEESAGGAVLSAQALSDIFYRLCEDSVYRCQAQINSGFLPVAGGFRVGLCGTAVTDEKGLVTVRDISSLCLRIPRSPRGIHEAILAQLSPRLLRDGLLLVGEPASGKTTLLRGVAAALSGAYGAPAYSVAIADERGELCLGGVPGPCCDVYTGYPKAQGILQAVRSLAPEYLVVDEITTQEELDAVQRAALCGAGLIACMHGGNVQQLLGRPLCKKALESGIFAHVAVLAGRSSPGVVTGIYSASVLLNEKNPQTLYHPNSFSGAEGGMPSCG